MFNGPGERIELWNSSLRIALLPDGVVLHEDGRRSPEADVEPPTRDQSRMDFIAGFARAVVNGTQPAVPVRDALAVQAIVAAAYASAEQDRPVRLVEVLGDADLTPAHAGVKALAARVVAAVRDAPEGSVQVLGEGLLAEHVGRLLPTRSGSGRPQAVIETTGREANVQRAITDVETLGTVVLAAPVDAEVVNVSGYTDIHVRGLTVVGLAGATDGPVQLRG